MNLTLRPFVGIVLTSLLCLSAHAQFGEHVQYFSQVGIGGGATTFFTIHNPTDEAVVVLLEICLSESSNAGYDREVNLVPGATVTIVTLPPKTGPS